MLSVWPMVSNTNYFKLIDWFVLINFEHFYLKQFIFITGCVFSSSSSKYNRKKKSKTKSVGIFAVCTELERFKSECVWLEVWHGIIVWSGLESALRGCIFLGCGDDGIDDRSNDRLDSRFFLSSVPFKFQTYFFLLQSVARKKVPSSRKWEWGMSKWKKLSKIFVGCKL